MASHTCFIVSASDENCLRRYANDKAIFNLRIDWCRAEGGPLTTLRRRRPDGLADPWGLCLKTQHPDMSAIRRLTALELSIQAEVQRLRDTTKSDFESRACAAACRTLFAQHRVLLDEAQRRADIDVDQAGGTIASTRDDELHIKLDAHRQIVAELDARMRAALVHGAARLRSDKANRAALGLDRTPPSAADVTNSNRGSRASHAALLQEEEELASLERAHAALQDEVRRSEAALHEFEKSSSALRETNDEYKSQASTMTVNRRLASKLRQREFTDKVILIVCCAFVALVALSIVNKRLIGPIFSASSWAVGLGGGGSGGSGSGGGSSSSSTGGASAPTVVTASATTLSSSPQPPPSVPHSNDAALPPDSTAARDDQTAGAHGTATAPKATTGSAGRAPVRASTAFRRRATARDEL